MANRVSKLFNDSLIFAIGSFGSKLVTFLLVPLYTFTLTKTEFGLMDLLITTINLSVPLVSLSMAEGMLRFVMAKEDEKKVLNTSLAIELLMILIITAFSIILYLFKIISLNVFMAVLLSDITIIQLYFSQYLRAKNRIKEYAINGILLSSLMLISNFILLYIFRLGLPGYFFAAYISNIISIIYMLSITRVGHLINFHYISKIYFLKLLKYSLPLIPNSIMWWLINASNRYFIVIFLGIEQNALFSVSTKIPGIMNILSSVFFQAWQLSAIEEYETNRESKFFNNIFNMFIIFMGLGSIFILIFIKPVISIIVADTYFESWKYMPIQMISIYFASLSSFLGSNYIAAKKTTGVLSTSLIGGVVSLLFNLLLINLIGLYGVSLSSAVSFFVIFVLRFNEVKKYTFLEFNLFDSLILVVEYIFISLLLFTMKDFIIFCVLSISSYILIVFIFIKRYPILKQYVLILVNKFYNRNNII